MFGIPQIRPSVFALRDASKKSLGVLDLGGASMQITFVPEATGDLSKLAGLARSQMWQESNAGLQVWKQ